MTIAFDAKRAFWNARGLGNYSRDVIRLMQTFAPDNDYLLCGIPNRMVEFPYHQHTTIVSPKWLWKLAPSLWRSVGVLNHLDRVDVYHGLSGELPYGIHQKNIRTVVTMHDAIFIRYPELYSKAYGWYFTKKVQYACDVADTIIAISEQTKSDMIEFFHADERKIEVVYQGCNNIFRQHIMQSEMDYVRSNYKLPEHYLLAVGAIEERKNLKRLIEAMASAHIDRPLVLLGARSKYCDELETYARRIGVRVLPRHGVNFKYFPAIYKGADVLCYPSIFEGFGIPILEAMCVGTPVLTSKGSCFQETGGDAALYADPLNAEEIGEQLAHILSNEELRKKMIADGFHHANQFADEKVAENLKRILLRKI